MKKEDILKIIDNNPDSYTMIIKAHHKDFYNKINTEFVGDKFGEKLYRYINDDVDLGKCKNCGGNTKFKSFVVGFTLYCCKKCSNTATSEVRSASLKETNQKNRANYYEIKKCAVCSNEFESLKFRKQKCCSAKCSGIYVASQPNRIKKIKKTKLKKYGNATYVNPEKAKQTCMERYGVDNIFKFRDVKELIKEGNLNKYGMEYPSQSPEIKNKTKNANLKKYGVENPSKLESTKNKVKHTFIKNYGVDNVFKHKETMQEVYIENIKKYGSKIPVNGELLKSSMLVKMKKLLYESITDRLINKSECIPLFTVDEYISTDKVNKYKFQCKKCNTEFYDHIDGGHLPRCLGCDPLITIGESKAEKEIVEYIKSLVGDDNVIENDRTILSGLELDVYIPQKNVAVEYDGLYWHGEKGGGKGKKYHVNKTTLCNAKGIKLIHIFENEWIHKKDIVKSKLKHLLQENTDKSIYARKCVIKETTDIADFLNKNHIQGDGPSSIKIGAYYNNELVAAMTFGKRRVALGKKTSDVGEYELLRFATSCKVVGIGSKLLHYFIKTYNPIKITTYADKRYSIGSLYEKIGFVKKHETDPNYWYFIDGTDRLWHRFNFRKDQLSKKLEVFDDNLSEWENMKNNGYDRIWDCGNILYEWIKK